MKHSNQTFENALRRPLKTLFLVLLAVAGWAVLVGVPHPPTAVEASQEKQKPSRRTPFQVSDGVPRKTPTKRDTIAGYVEFIVVRSAETADQAMSVQFSTLDGTARAGVDYRFTTGRLYFAAGQTQATVNVPLPNENVIRDNLHFTLRVEAVEPIAPRRGFLPLATYAGGGISIPTQGVGSPYPSTISVSGETGIILDVNIQLTNLSHTSIRDISFLLESPAGTRVNILNRRGLDTPFTGTLVFDDQASQSLQPLVAFGSGTYLPSGDSVTDPYPGLTPSAGPWALSLSAVNGQSANGTWSLYCIDPLANDSGSLESWSLSITSGCPTVTLSPSTLPSATAGTAYAQTISASPAGSYSFAVTAGSLPPGLNLSSGGVLSGIPTATGTFNFTVTASGTCSGSQSYSLNVGCPTIALSSLPNGVVGTAYSQTITASPTGGGYGFTVTSGALPPGLALSGGGALTGTPTATGTFNFTVTATGFGSCTGSQAYSLVIACPTITLSPTTLPGGTAGTAYNQTISAAPAGGGYTFAVTAGTLPTGLSLSAAGALSGTPTAQGTFNFTVTATGFGTCTGSRAFSLVIACPTITVNPVTLPGGTAGVPYSQSFTATGTLGAPTFTVSSGTLPAGFTLNPTTGVLSGTPTAAGNFTLSVRATDTNAGTNTCFGERAYSLLIACPTIAVGPASLAEGTAAAAYSQTITATGTLGAPTFTVSSGTLPAGLTLTTAGVLSGTPTVTGTFNVTIRAMDTNAGTNTCFGERAYSLVLTCPPITVSPAVLPPANFGIPYNQTVTASGGIAPYTYTVTAGTPPPGIALSAGGLLAGTSTTVGTFQFTVTATDANGCTGSTTYSIQVNALELNRLYVADTDNSRVQVFDGSTWVLAPGSTGVIGGGPGQFRFPEAVAATFDGKIFVADTGNNRIHWYNGFTWSNFVTLGSASNQVRAPQGLALDVTGRFLFVADTGNNRILRFDATSPGAPGILLADVTQVVGPRGLATDNLGNLFIADTGNSRVLRIANATTTTAVNSGTVVTSALRAPEGVAVDNDGNLYIADTGNSRILQLAGGTSGTPVTLATLGTALGSVRSAEGVTVTSFASGPLAGRYLLVGDTINNRIQARPLAGGAWSIVGGTGSGLGQFRSPSKIR